VAALLIGLSTAPVSGEPMESVRLTCRLSLDEARVRARAPVELRFTVCNDAEAPVAILRWHTPLEGFFSDQLEVTKDGKPVKYRGPLAKRGDPGRDDYVVLEPGKCQSSTIDVASAYDLATRGTYTVRWKRGIADWAAPAAIPRPLDQHRELPLSCGAVTVTVMG
jgi:hypothetical protein